MASWKLKPLQCSPVLKLIFFFVFLGVSFLIAYQKVLFNFASDSVLDTQVNVPIQISRYIEVCMVV